MPAVRMYDGDQYAKAIEVLTNVGGTWHGVGSDEKYLIVNDSQYQALVEANVVKSEEKKGMNRGKSASRPA